VDDQHQMVRSLRPITVASMPACSAAAEVAGGDGQPALAVSVDGVR